MDKKNLTLSIAPHVHSGHTTNKIMLLVIGALMPAAILSVAVFGLPSLIIYAVTITSCVIFETLFNLATGRQNSIGDYSAALTGVLLAMNLPASVPLWLAIVGAFVAIVIAKMVFGGLGANPFNPALAARIFLLISFPVQMTSYILPKFGSAVDATSSATVLGSSKMYFQMNGSMTGFDLPSLSDLFMGFNPGAMGETSVIALSLGGIFLIATRVITWHIPVAFIGTVFLMSLGFHSLSPDTTLHPLMQLCSGGLMLGAFFMATDYVTSPIYGKGKIIFGIGCGILTVVIRLYGGYPEGVGFAILIMNAVTPLLDKYMRPRAYGEAK